MALIKCPECGRRVSDTIKRCIHCGFELTIKSIEQNEITANDKSQHIVSNKIINKKFIRVFFASIGGVFVICIILFFAFGLNLYTRGAIAYSRGDYRTAVDLLSESEYTLDKHKLPNAKIALAKEFIATEDWQQAYNLLASVKTEESGRLLPEVKYNLAKKEIDSGEWSGAVGLLTGLRYKDSDELLECAIRGKGMSENADYAFLASLKESISRRMEINAKEKSDFRTLVTTELAYVGKYKNEEFYDSNLKTLAIKYIKGLNTQLDALDEEWISDYQVNWIKGLVERYEVLCELYETYDFMQGDQDFVGTYVSQLDEQKELLKAYQAVEADIKKQLMTVEVTYKNQYISFTLKNNTKYTYGTIFEFRFYDKNKTIIDTRTDAIENIRPGNSYIISIYVAYPNKVDTWYWGNYYTDMG